jgi:hypothetical protein
MPHSHRASCRTHSGTRSSNLPTEPIIAKNRNTYAKRQREQEKKQRADDKRLRRERKKEKQSTPLDSPSDVR